MHCVNIQDIDNVAVPSMHTDNENVRIVSDEIGKMECFSSFFRGSILLISNSKNPVLSSIALNGGPLS